MQKTLQQHINDDRDELNNSTISPQRRRHIEDELNSLEHYQKNHPEDDYDPSYLQLYCDLHPDSLECKMYDI